jgi:aromatic ring-opening dioxygenase LigB subunit
VELVGTERLGDLLGFDADFIERAKADSFWQLLMLHGALGAADGRWRSELLSYEAPTYFGMLCAAYEPM